MSGQNKPTQEEIMVRLAGQFPAMKGAPGIDPWDPMTLDEWGASGAASSGEKVIVRFLLAIRNGSEDYWKTGPFRLRDLNQLDDANFEAWRTWATRPFFL